MSISIVMPFINRADLAREALTQVAEYASADAQIIAYNNGCEDIVEAFNVYPNEGHHQEVCLYEERNNRGIIHVLKKCAQLANHDIICFMHNDILVWEKNFDKRIEEAFDKDHKLGLAGFVGGAGVHENGRRIEVMSNMQGIRWGKCDCHNIAAEHHGNVMTGFAYASVLDACVLIFRKYTFWDLEERTDALSDKRPPNHWYDRNIPLHLIRMGYRVGIIGVPFDHYSANTADQTTSFNVATKEWLEKNNIPIDRNNLDAIAYHVGREEFEKQWGPYLPCTVDVEGNYSWHSVPPYEFNIRNR
jgi:glycosyltransferase involved in cell wall biosynthesis